MISLLSVDVFQACLCGRYRRISCILSSCFWIRDRGTVFSFWYFYLTFDARSLRLLFSVCQCFTLKAQGYICKWLKMYLHLSIRPKSRAIEFRIELLVIYGGIFKSWRIVFSAIFHRLWSDTFFSVAFPTKSIRNIAIMTVYSTAVVLQCTDCVWPSYASCTGQIVLSLSSITHTN